MATLAPHRHRSGGPRLSPKRCLVPLRDAGCQPSGRNLHAEGLRGQLSRPR